MMFSINNLVKFIEEILMENFIFCAVKITCVDFRDSKRLKQK